MKDLAETELAELKINNQLNEKKNKNFFIT